MEIKKKISFDQSVSSGFIGIHGSVEWDGNTELHNLDTLVQMLQDQEIRFREAGYKVASDIVPKTKPQNGGTA